MKKNTGITLVALVVTIIILLILAGISIATLTGSGLFENAKLAKEKSDKAQEKPGDLSSSAGYFRYASSKRTHRAKGIRSLCKGEQAFRKLTKRTSALFPHRNKSITGWRQRCMKQPQGFQKVSAILSPSSIAEEISFSIISCGR